MVTGQSVPSRITIILIVELLYSRPERIPHPGKVAVGKLKKYASFMLKREKAIPSLFLKQLGSRL